VYRNIDYKEFGSSCIKEESTVARFEL